MSKYFDFSKYTFERIQSVVCFEGELLMRKNLRWLYTFCTVARVLNYKRAAEELFLTPSAIRSQISERAPTWCKIVNARQGQWSLQAKA